jgi:hypothetical protein
LAYAYHHTLDAQPPPLPYASVSFRRGQVIFSAAHWLCCAWYGVGDNAYDGEDGRALQLDADGAPLRGWVHEKFGGNASGATALRCYGTC